MSQFSSSSYSPLKMFLLYLASFSLAKYFVPVWKSYLETMKKSAPIFFLSINFNDLKCRWNCNGLTRVHLEMLFSLKACLSRESQFTWDKGRPRSNKATRRPEGKRHDRTLWLSSFYSNKGKLPTKANPQKRRFTLRSAWAVVSIRQCAACTAHEICRPPT